MFDLALDWEQKIIDLCEKYQINTDQYNNNDELKETIAKELGFSSFSSFQKFPNPNAIIGGMGTNITEEYLPFVPSLLDDCCKSIQKKWIFDRNETSRNEQINYFLIYIIENNLPVEFSIAAILNMIENYNFPYEDAIVWNEVLKKYKHLL